jgi:hypothetical protein
MATVLCAWEQGGNLGHLSNLRNPIEMALQLGHRVLLAARELHRVPEVLGGLPIELLPAPFKQYVQPADKSAFLSITHVLARQCFSGVDELEMYLRAWQTLFDLVQPDLVMYEHSPTALIASHGRPFKKVLVGSGFAIPPLPEPGEPFAPFSTTSGSAPVRAGLLADDALVLTVVNQALGRLGRGPLPDLAQIYRQADASLLLSWPELDHFGARPGQRYLGAVPLGHQPPAVWPDVSGPKVFGYLQAMPSIEALLRCLREAGVCALLLVRGLPLELKLKYSSERLRFLDGLVDLASVAAQADGVIHHANHSSLIVFTEAGLPQLLIPRQQEQLLLALRLAAHGGAVLAYQDQPGFDQETQQLLTDPKLRAQARALAQSCQRPDPAQNTAFMQNTLRSLLA